MVTDIKEGYKSTEIGVIPFDWDLKNVEEISSVATGNKDTQNKLENGIYDFYVRSQKVEKINSYSFDGEAVLTAGDGVGVGKVYHYVTGKFDYHQRVYKISDFKNIDGKFFFYYFSENFMKVARKYNSKTSVDSVRRHMITEMKVPIPPMIEQLKIVEILTAADEQIEKTEQLIEKTKELKKGLMQQLLTKGINHTKLKNTHLGNIPVEWNIVSFKSVCSIVQGLVSPNEEPYLNYPHIGNANIEKETGKLHSYKLAKEENLISGKYLFGENHVLYGKINPHFAKVAYPKFVGICSADMYPIECKKDILPMFLKFALLSSRFTKEMTASSARTGIPKVNRKEVENYNFLLPPIEEQQKIADILSSVTEQLEVYEKEKDKQIELRKALMQQLLTGKIRVAV